MLLRGVFMNMNIHLRVRNIDSFLVECFEYFFVHRKENVPIIRSIYPGPHHKVYRAVCQF